MATKREIMLACLRQLSMVYGTATNRYAEEKLYSMIDDALVYLSYGSGIASSRR